MEKKLSIIAVVLAVIALALAVFSLVSPPKTEKQEELDTQYVMYLGTNDKDTYEPYGTPEETKAKVDEVLSWAQCFAKADIDTKHLIVSRLIERVDARTGYKIHIKLKMSMKQCFGQE